MPIHLTKQEDSEATCNRTCNKSKLQARQEDSDIVETAIYLVSTFNLVLLICIAVDVSNIKKMVENLKEDSKQFMFLMQKLVDRLDVKDGDGE